MEVPGLIGNADVFCYAVVNPSLSGNNLTHLAYGAAICKYEAVAGYYLFYCDDNWKEYADTWHETIEDAKDQAEYDDAGISES
jgi:hypothetical protein